MRCFFTNEKCNEMMRWISLINKLFSDIKISQGSVATRLKCDGIFNERCIANFLEIITVKEFFFKSAIFDEVMCRAFGVHFFGPPCIPISLTSQDGCRKQTVT